MNISVGQYYPTGSLIHKLDARTKIIITMLFLTFIFISKTFIGNFISSIFLLLVIIISKIPFKIILGSIKGVLFLICFTTITNLFFNQQGKILLEFYFLKITTGGLIYSARMIFRLLILIIGSCMLTFTTSTLDFADGVESLLNPLKKIGFPSHEISMMITIALRFIPTIIEELDKIKKSQMCRGIDFETGNILKKIRNFIPILIPIFVSSFKRADELAMAMEARCYRGDINRTKMKVLSIYKNDYIAIGICIFYIFTIFLVRITVER